jgi:UDP-sugar diphosphatase
MRKGPGGGLAHEGEFIEVIELSVDEVKTFVDSKNVKCPPWTLYGVMWFLTNKLHLLKKN